MTSVLNKIMPNGQVAETLREEMRLEMWADLQEAAKTQPLLADLFNIQGVTYDNWTFEGIAHMHSLCVLKLK